MSMFDDLYNDKSENEVKALKPTEILKLDFRKNRVKKWIKTCLKGAVEANNQSLGKLDEELITFRSRLVNGDESMIKRIMENRYVRLEAEKQTPFIFELYKDLFGEDLE